MPGQTAGVVDVDANEEIHVGDDVALPEPVLAELEEQVVPPVAVKVVAQLLIGPLAETRARLLRSSEPGDRVVPAAIVGDDRTENPSQVGIENPARGQEGGELRLQRVGHVVAFDRIARVVEERR